MKIPEDAFIERKKLTDYLLVFQPDSDKSKFWRRLDLHQTTFAMGESIAHLHMLWRAGQLRRVRGTDGVIRFSAV